MAGFPDPESTAAELLHAAEQGHPPVDLLQVARRWPGLHVTTEDLDHEGYLIDLGARGGEILLRASDPPERQRYTLAHELGHWVLRCANGETSGKLAATRQPRVERWCDHLAANLLMPKAWVIHHLRLRGPDGLVKAVLSGPPVFRVSQEAFRLRVAELTDVSIFELRHKDGQAAVERNYEATGAPRDRLEETLRGVISLIRKRKEPGVYLHRDTQFKSVHDVFAGGIRNGRWLVCMFPR